MSCGVDCRHGLDPELLWLCSRLAAVALIQPLAWELPYAAGVALKKQKIKKRESVRVKDSGEQKIASAAYDTA